MHEINWNRFELKNPNPQDAFETMCRNIFLREYKVSSHNFSANYNQAGLETEPVLFNGKQYGFQCKYSTSGNSSAMYTEVLASLTKAVGVYPNLNTVIIYTNLDIKPNVSVAELLKPKKTNRVKIHELGKNHGVEIIWFVKPNFEKALNEVGNYDLYRAFFSPQDTHGFLHNSLSHDERTFLVSDQFIDLPLHGTRFSRVNDEILSQKISIITGAAGTGKSEILKKLYLQCENLYLSNAKKVPSNADIPIPVFVRLRECVNGNLEELLRNRLKDFEINLEEGKNSYIYFFDGLDEISAIDFSGVLTCMIRLYNKAATKSFVLASRTNSANLTSVIRSLNSKTYNVDPLKSSDVEDYFKKLNSPEKQKILQEIKDKNSTFFEGITDIFSAVLLSEYALEIESSTTKVDLIRLNAEKLIEGSNKYSSVNLPEPKVQSVERILAQVSELMQRTGNISISRTELQRIIREQFPNCSYIQVDEIIDCISEIFFDSASTYLLQKRYSYRHKRYFEYFLYTAIREKFYTTPSILRELRLLSNKDFIQNIFLVQEIKNNTLSSNIQHILALRFFEAYLGEEYMSDAQSSWFMPERLWISGSESYLQSNALREFLCTKHIDDLQDFLKTDPLSIKRFLKQDNYYAFVRQYHEANSVDIRPLLNEIYGIQDQWLQKAAEKDLVSFFYCETVIDRRPIEAVYSTVISKITVQSNDLDHYPYNRNRSNVVIDFFELALVSFADWLLSAISNISVQHLETLSYVLLRSRNFGFIIKQAEELTPLATAIKNRVTACDKEQFGIHTITLLGILTNTVIQKADIEARASKVNVTHYETWRTNFELNNYVGKLLGEEFRPAHHDYKLGIALRRIVHDNYPNNKQEVLPLILQEVNKYNLVYKNWFSYYNAVFVGEIIATLDIDIAEIKRFIVEIRKYGSVVSTFQVLYTIMKRNLELFKIIANPTLLTAEYSKACNELSYYDDNSDLAFIYATMISHFDIVKADALFENAINNSIFRPIFRKEDMLDYHLPHCLMIAYNNFWLTNDELELAIRRVAGILKVAKDTLDSGAYSGYFKFVIEQCCPHLSDFYQNVNVTAEDPERVIGWESCSSKVPLESITLDNLQQYYGCEIEGLNYSSLSAWKDLIHVELNENDELTLLYDMLEKNYFPSSNWTKMNRCFHIIIAVLISDPKTKPKAIDYLMNRAGRMGLVILIQAYALLGDDQSGRESIEQLLRLCEALVYPSSEYNGTVVFSGNRDLEIVGEVCNSTISDWKYDGGDYVMHYLPDQKITIRWDRQEDQEPFSEEWAVKHPDKKAYSTSYYICYEQRIIKTFGMVHVDGGRALIPMPNYVTNHIDRASYKLACLVNSDIENLKRYIVSSGLIVD